MTAHKTHDRLERAIHLVVLEKENYVMNPKSDFTRNRKLSMKETVKQILAMEGGSLKKEIDHFAEQRKLDLTPSAFVQQRSKISSKAFETIFKHFNALCNDSKKHKGYRLLAVDGSDISHFRNPDLESFVTSKTQPYGYNQTHLNALYDLLNKTYVDVLLQPKPKSDERGAFIEMLKRNSFQSKSIIMADRGYESYNLIAHLMNTKNADFLLRARHGAGGIHEIAKLPMMEIDKDITFEVTTTQTNEDKLHRRRVIQVASKKKINSPKTSVRRWDFASPYRLKFRVVRFMLETGEYETIVTSLPRSKFSISEIKELYHMRWGIETSFRDLKYAIGLNNLHCKKDDLVVQEIYAALIMYNYCSRMSASAVIKKNNGSLYSYQINFTMAIHLCKFYYKQSKTNFNQLLAEIGQYCEPIRPGRSDKRNIYPKRFVGFAYRVAA